jgi:hypothetical protein
MRGRNRAIGVGVRRAGRLGASLDRRGARHSGGGTAKPDIFMHVGI